MSFLDRLFPKAQAITESNGVPPTMEMPRWGSDGSSRQSSELRVEAGLLTDPGCVRESNEDFVRIIRPTTPEELAKRGILAVVCDGMGGHEAGEIASRLAVETIVHCFENDDSDPLVMLPRAVQAANRAIYDTGTKNRSMRGMGTTCTALLLRGGFAYSAHVGDSRLYLMRAGDVFLMTEDHSAVMDLVRRGLLTREESRNHPDKNVISRALGSHPTVEVTHWPQPFAVRAGDRFLLCSDGLYDLVSDEQLLVIAGEGHPQVACDRLIRLARTEGGHDNISVALLAMTGDAEGTPVALRETRGVELPQ